MPPASLLAAAFCRRRSHSAASSLHCSSSVATLSASPEARRCIERTNSRSTARRSTVLRASANSSNGTYHHGPYIAHHRGMWVVNWLNTGNLMTRNINLTDLWQVTSKER